MTKEERIDSARCLKESGNKLFSVSAICLYQLSCIYLSLVVPFHLDDCLCTTRDAVAIAGQGGQQERKGTENHIQQIFIILFSNRISLILLGTGFVLIRE